VVIFGSMSPAGEKLKNMTGVAAILRFSLPGLDDVMEDEDPGNSSDEDDYVANDESSSDEAGES
jgi:hypothetical protein